MTALAIMAAAARFMTDGKQAPIPVCPLNVETRRRFQLLVVEARRAGLMPRGWSTIRINRLAEFETETRFAYIELLPNGNAYVMVTDESTFTECWEFTVEETYVTMARLHRLLYNTPE